MTIKLLIGLAILVAFVVVTQWDNLVNVRPPAPAASKVSSAPKLPEQRSFNFPETPPAEKARAAEVGALLAKRMARVTIEEPNVQADGSISGNGQTLHLYGIKQFNSKTLCRRASGEPWACGLHAYAMLRNTIANETIVCDPKTLLPNSVAATCRVGSTDIALMLVRNGLAELDNNIDDADLVNAQASAKSQRLGIWDR